MSNMHNPETAEPITGSGAMSRSFRPEVAARWEWSAEEIQRIGYRVVDLIAAHLTGLPERAVFRPVPADVRDALLSPPLPHEGASPDSILDAFARLIEPYPFGNGHPRFYGWVNSPPDVMGIFAEALAAAMNPSMAGGNHAAVYVEHQVLGWLRDLIGFPRESGGLLVTGASMATLTGLAVARHVRAGRDMRAAGLQGGGSRLVVYSTSETHSCARKSVEMLGIGSDNLRLVPTDGQRRMQAADLEAAITQDLRVGHQPIAVVASAGTVNTGAIDPLAAIADVCRRHEVWLHVDGAYGAPAILTPAYRESLAPLALADSVAIDPHKWLYVPVEAGAVLVRDAQAMRNTFSLVPPYLRTDNNVAGVMGLPWFSEFGFQQTRGFRALKVWMALQHHGFSGYAEAIAHDCALAGYLAEQVSAGEDLDLVATGLSIVCFRYAPPAMRADTAALNALNEQIVREVQLGGRTFLTSTVLEGRFVLRACIVNFRATQADIDVLVDTVRRAGARLVTPRASDV